jgi:hypothetical protein
MTAEELLLVSVALLLALTAWLIRLVQAGASEAEVLEAQRDEARAAANDYRRSLIATLAERDQAFVRASRARIERDEALGRRDHLQAVLDADLDQLLDGELS